MNRTNLIKRCNYLEKENKALKTENSGLKERNKRLKSRLIAYENACHNKPKKVLEIFKDSKEIKYKEIEDEN